MKLFLYSTWLLSPEHRLALAELVGKAPQDVTFAAITNAVDVVKDAESWIGQSLESLGQQVEVVDLRQWQGNQAGLLEKLANKDVIWVSAGNGFYLRWLLRESGGEQAIRELVSKGQVYAGWGGGGVVAGPTLEFFKDGEDPADLALVPTIITDGMHLTNIVPVPHMDLAEFSETMQQINTNLLQAGYETVPLKESQALIINGDERKVI